MNTIYVIIIYTIISLIFLVVIGVKIIIKSKRNQEEFSFLFPRLLNHLKLEEYKNAKDIFDKIKWNPNYTFFNYVDIYSTINLSIETKDDIVGDEMRNILMDEINKNCEEKGWNIHTKLRREQTFEKPSLPRK